LSKFSKVALACLLLYPVITSAQEEAQEPPALETPASRALTDGSFAKVAASVQDVTTRDVAALAKALHIEGGLGGPMAGAAFNTLTPAGDLDGDGVPEVLLKWAMPEVPAGAEVAPAPDSRPLWCVYLLSWDGSHWKVSHLVIGVEEYRPMVINLGPPVGRALAMITRESASGMAYPVIFQVRDHTATLLWDAQSDDSLYKPLLQGQVSFRDNANGSTEMMVSGRADPGLLQCEPNGHRGFDARAIYHWDGKAFVPLKTEYVANQDYTVYRFISALHLHDYRSAYALIAPASSLQVESPTLDAFRQYVQDNLPEFLQDEVFEAPEPPAGSADEHLFVLSQSDKRNVYHPLFSTDGKFLLTGLSRTHETLPTEPRVK
jgi:hypothetical protein